MQQHSREVDGAPSFPDDASKDISAVAGEYTRPALVGNAVTVIFAEKVLNAKKEGSTGGQGEKADLQERFDDVRFRGQKLSKTVVGLE